MLLTSPSDTDVHALELQGIDKSFAGVRVLKDVSFACRAGEVHVLMGENGAGKSTLMRIITGVWTPEAGRIFVRGEPVEITRPKQSQDLGVAMVYQDTRLRARSRRRAERLARARARRRDLSSIARRWSAAQRRSSSVSAPTSRSIRPVRDLSVAERQIVEIARALTTSPSVLILDEPTSALDAAEIQQLFEIVRELKRGGAAMIFISHRLPEVFAIADRITVLKDGEVVGTVNRDEVDHERLVAMMVGREMALAYPARATSSGRERPRRREAEFPRPVRGCILRRARRRDRRARRHPGQRTGRCRARDLRPRALDRRGEAGRRAGRAGIPAKAIRAGLVYVPGERHREGLFLPHSVRENISLPHLACLGVARPAAVGPGAAGDGGRHRPLRRQDAFVRAERRPSLRRQSAEGRARPLDDRARRKCSCSRIPRAASTSRPSSKSIAACARLAAEGAAVVLVSSDLMELIGLSDRILVFSRGRVCARSPAPTPPKRPSSAARRALATRMCTASSRRPRTTSDANPRRVHPMLERYAGALLLAALIVALAFAALAFLAVLPHLAQFRQYREPGRSARAGRAWGNSPSSCSAASISRSARSISLVTAITSFVAVSEGAGGVVAAVAAALGVGLVTGALNALLIVRLRIPDLIATLATYSIVFGAALIVRPAPGGLISETFIDLVTTNIGPVPVAALLIVIAFGLAELLLRARPARPTAIWRRLQQRGEFRGGHRRRRRARAAPTFSARWPPRSRGC